MLNGGRLLALAILMAVSAAAYAQDAKKLVEQAVRAELAADAADHTHWLFYEVDQKPGVQVKQWVAQAAHGDLTRMVEKNGQPVSKDQSRKAMESFAQSTSAQARQRKSGEHDDKQATEMLNMLPRAFIWSDTGSRDGNTTLHFKPDPQFHPPSYQARVFAAMEGDMRVNDAEHRIVSLKGRLVRDVKFGGGLLGELQAGGSFDVERRQTGGAWQITETHVHIQGHALLFKDISEQEDDVKSRFKQLPGNISFADAEKDLLALNE
jgi:hypothetical protein